MNSVLLFDFDGTIADSFESFIEIINKLAVKHNLQVPQREELEKLRIEDPRTLIKRFNIPLYKIPLLARDMKKMQAKQIAHITPYAGLPEVLKNLKGLGYTLGILTSNGKENVETFLTKHDITLFDSLQSDTSLFGKDRAIRKFIRQNAIAKERVLYVGDEIRDIQACRKVGVKIIAVTWGFNSREGLERYDPDFLIDTPPDILQVVTDNFKQDVSS